MLRGPTTLRNTAKPLGTKDSHIKIITTTTTTTPTPMPTPTPTTGYTATHTLQRVSITVSPETGGGACRDPISTQDTTATTSIQDALKQLRELYREAKKRQRIKKEKLSITEHRKTMDS